MLTYREVLAFFRNFKPAMWLGGLTIFLDKIIKVVVIWRIIRGLLILIGTITLLKWIGFDFTHVLRFFADLPILFDLQDTWLGRIYTFIFEQILDLITGIADNAPPPPDGKELLEAIADVIKKSKDM